MTAWALLRQSVLGRMHLPWRGRNYAVRPQSPPLPSAPGPSPPCAPTNDATMSLTVLPKTKRVCDADVRRVVRAAATEDAVALDALLAFVEA